MSKYNIDMTKGPIFSKLLRFAVPLFMTNLLQQLYSVADTAVVGKFDANGTESLAAVGGTSTLTALLLLMFTGVATGAGVVVAQHIGADDKLRRQRAMETSVIFAFLSGVVLIFAGYFLSRPLLVFMQCDPTVLDKATLYMKIYFLGAPASLLYNFGSCILRAHGDTKRPMFILTLAGIVNVILNLLLVIVFKLSVAGVAFATVASQVVTAVCALYLLFHPQGEYRLRLRGMRFDWKEMLFMLKIGIPVGLNGILFSVANVVIQREVNGIGHIAMAGNAAASALDKITHLGVSSFSQAAISFAGQNVGAKKYRRLDTVLWQSVASAVACSALISIVFVVFNEPFLNLFISAASEDRASIIAAALPKLVMVGVGYMILAPEDILGCMLKGMGKSTAPVVINLVCVTAVRFLWVFLVFYTMRSDLDLYDSLWVLYGAYPVSWLVSCVGQFIAYLYYRRREFSNASEDAAREAQGEKTPA